MQRAGSVVMRLSPLRRVLIDTAFMNLPSHSKWKARDGGGAQYSNGQYAGHPKTQSPVYRTKTLRILHGRVLRFSPTGLFSFFLLK